MFFGDFLAEMSERLAMTDFAPQIKKRKRLDSSCSQSSSSSSSSSADMPPPPPKKKPRELPPAEETDTDESDADDEHQQRVKAAKECKQPVPNWARVMVLRNIFKRMRLFAKHCKNKVRESGVTCVLLEPAGGWQAGTLRLEPKTCTPMLPATRTKVIYHLDYKGVLDVISKTTAGSSSSSSDAKNDTSSLHFDTIEPARRAIVVEKGQRFCLRNNSRYVIWVAFVQREHE